MAITSYSELQSAIANWLGRDDLTARIPEFIALFEAAACRRLGVRETQTTTSLTPSSGTASLPSDFLYAKRVTWTGTPPVDLEFVHPSIIASKSVDETGIPNKYTIEGSNLKIRPVSDTALELLYSQRTAAVSSTLNWLLTKHPDAYLYGSLAEAEGFLVNDERMATWLSRREQAFDEINRADFRFRGPMQVRVAGYTP